MDFGTISDSPAVWPRVRPSVPVLLPGRFPVGWSTATEAELFALLNGSDQLEIILRDVGAFIYERRMGDRVGGAHMRALRVPGANVDILPDWMIKEGPLHSKVEHQRHERVSDKKKVGPKGQGKSKDQKGKGKKKGGAAAKGAAQPPHN